MTKDRAFISEINELVEPCQSKTTKRIRQQIRRDHPSVRMLAVAVSMCFSVAQVQAITTIAAGTTETIPGTQTSPWTLTDHLIVDGTMEIVTGGTVFNLFGAVGDSSNSIGTVTVDGTGSTWSNSGNLNVGSLGNGSLTITDGGTVTVGNISVIGSRSGSLGIVRVDGTGSTWTISSQLSVGTFGTGTVIITGGGVVSNTGAMVGNEAIGTGTVTVDGAGSIWTNSDFIHIGRNGTGTLNIVNGGKVTAGNTTSIGYDLGSTGIARVDGTGSTLTISGYLAVGLVGNGSLTITDGGTVSNGIGYIGANAGGGIGTVTVDGEGSRWTNSGSLYIGNAGNGSLAITGGGTVSNTYGYIGRFSDSTGTVTVDGSGSTWTNSSALYIGSGGAGKLTISDSGTVSVGGVVTVANFAGSEGKINIGAAEGSAAVAAGTLDTAEVTFGRGDGTLVFNHTDNSYLFDAAITSADGSSNTSGTVKVLSGTTIITGASMYYGDTFVTGGTLQAGVADTFSANSSYTVSSAGTLNLDGFDQTVASLSNAGTVRISSASSANAVGTTLTVNGNYESNGGELHIRTVLGDDTSATDKLVAGSITVGAGGATSLYVTNTGGLGAQTVNGIEVVHVTGSSAGDAFVLGRAVTAGLYEYTLNQGADQNWYLSSELRQQTTYNPSLGAYLGNQTAATTLFMHTLYDRQGNANNLVSTGGEPRTAWVRVATRHSSGESVKGLMKTRTDQDLIHLGVDMGEWQVQDGNLHVGIMGAYGKSKTRVHQTDTQAKGSLDGYSVGVYGTWFADEAQGNGLYVDGWAQYNWFKNKVTSDSYTRGEEKYDSHLWTVSAEAGYGFMIGKTENTEIMLTPQVQLAYNYYDADDHMDRNDDLRVNGDKASGVVTRVGARLYGRSTSVFTARPFVEANWIYSSAKNTLNFDGETLRDGVPKNRLEAKLGIEGTIAKSWTLWGQAGVQWGKDSYHRYEGQFGLKYIW